MNRLPRDRPDRPSAHGRTPAVPGLRGGGLAVALLSAGAALVAAGCGGGALESSLAPVPSSARLYYDDSGGIQDSIRIVVLARDDWQELWSRATSARSEPPRRPVVDFDESMVLAVANGRMNPGDEIRVDSVGVREVRTPGGETREEVGVVVRTVRACSGFEAASYPLEIVRVRRFDLPVTFVERSEEGPGCGAGEGGTGAGAAPER